MKNILEYLENTPHPNRIAFDDSQAQLTFAEIQQQSRAIGSFLAMREIYKQPIPVFMEKSPQTISAFLGVVYGGNYYVPLDSSMADSRIQMILKKVNPSIIICDDSTCQTAKDWGYDVYTFSKLVTHEIDTQKLLNIRRHAIDIDPVYVVFTSGSTGTPKGVVATHSGVIDYVESLCPVIGANENSIFGNQSPLYLDACLKEIFPTLKYSAKTYLIPPSLFLFPVKLIEFINNNNINTICWVASALSIVAGLGALEKHVPKSLKVIAFGSEVFPKKHLVKWQEVLPDTKFVHLYGPTETTGMATYYIVDKSFEQNELVPIGKPFPNREIILLDENGKMPPQGQMGEIHIRGLQLSPGYFADEVRTKAAFIQNPLSPFPDIVYKTGDRGYQNNDGNFVFTARCDHQIKHMGYRIELTEIENAALSLNGIEMVCVVFDAEKSKIILYYTAAIEPSELNMHLKSTLPRYMQPHKMHQLEKMPLTPGGKIDRVALQKGNQ